MKIRTGFVSNSSSASFTLVWKVLKSNVEPGLELSVKEAVSALMDFSDYEEDVMAATSKGDAPNVFVSRFWTCMLNSESDIGCAATALYFTLSMQQKRGKYEILNAELIGDNDG